MADVVCKHGEGAAVEKFRDGANLIIVLLKTAQADDTLRDYDDLAAALAAGGGTANVEANFTNYARKTVANGSVTLTYDSANNRYDIDIADQTYTSAGGGTNNTLVKALFCEDGANDAARKILTAQDCAVTTDGNNLVLQIATAGFYRAA